jgi:IS4 transposase
VATLLQLNQFVFHRKIVRVNDQLCYLSDSKVMSKEGKPELQVIISFNEPEESKSLYKQRWQIESAFKALKSSGFNIEDTHLTEFKNYCLFLSCI